MVQAGITVKRFDSNNKGPILVAFGAIHGNESCGPIAISQIFNELKAGELSLLKGSVNFVPICNPAAYSENSRFIEQDLNRVFKHYESPVTNEEMLADSLCTLIDECDVLLDIHSTAAPGPVSVFIDFPAERNKSLASALGAEYALLNWPELYEGNEFFDSFDTTRYAFEAGKDGVLIECGQHNDPTSVAVAYKSILRTLSHLGMIETVGDLDTAQEMQSIKMVRLEQREDSRDELAEQWKHLQPILSGTLVATRASGEDIVADRDYIMLLPKYSALPGDEWFYLGIEI